MASPERILDDEPENDVIPDEQSWHDSRSIYSDEQSSISGAAPHPSHDSRSIFDDEGSHRSRGSQSERSYRSGEASYRSGDSRSFEDGDSRSFEDGDLRSFEDDEGSRRSRRSHSSGDGSHSSEEARSFAEDEESFRSQGSHSQKSPRSGEGSHRSGSSRSNADGGGSFRSQGWSRSSRGEESNRIGESSSVLGESGHQSGGSRSFQDETSFRSDRSEEYRSDHDRSEGGQSIGREPFDSQDNSDYSDDDGVESFEGDSPQHSQHSQASGESSSEDSEVPSFAEDSEVSHLASPTKSVTASPSAANGSDPFGNQVSDDEGASHAFGGSGFSNNPFDVDGAGAAFGTFENGGLESTEIERDFAGDVFASSAMDGLSPFGSGVATGDPFASEAFGSFGSGVDTGNDPFAAEFFGDNAFGAVALDASTNDSQRGSRIVDDEQAIESSSRGSQPDIPAAETQSSPINAFAASPLPSASIRGDGTPGFDDVFGNDEFDASFTNGESEFKSSAFANGSFDEKFDNDDGIKIDASFAAEGFGTFPAESQSFVESDDGGGTKSQTAGPLETTHLEGSFASGLPQLEESQSSNDDETSRGSQSGASGESRSFAEGEGSYHSREQSYHSSESRSSEKDNNSFGPQHDESRDGSDSKSEGKHQIEQSRSSRGSEYTDQDSTPSFGEDGSFEASGNAPQHEFTANDQDTYQSNSFHSDSRSQGEKSDGSTHEDRSVEGTNSVHSEGNLQDSFETGSQSDEKSFYSDDDQSQEASIKDEPQQDEESAYSKDTNEGGTKISTGPSEHSGEVEDEETEDKGEKSFDSGSYESSGPSFAEEESGHVSHVDDSRDDQARSNAPDIDSSQTDDNELAKGDVEDDDDESIGIGDVFGQPNELFEQPATSEKVEGQRTRSQKDHSESIDNRNDSSPQGSVKNETSVPYNAQGSPVKPAPKPKLYPKPKDKEDPEERRRRKKRKKKLQKAAKSDALLALVSNVNEAMLELEAIEAEQPDFEETSAHRLLHGFDALLGIYLQLSDELELLSTFAQAKKRKEREAMVPLQALKAVLSFAATLDELFADLQPIILDCFEEDPDEEMDDMLYRLNSLVDLLCETTHRVGERQEWNERAETTYVTLLELMEREATELISYFEDVDTPEQILSANIHEAWSATGHIEELRALQYASDPWLFRQLCYEVMVSTDQWCPDTTILMEICGIDPSLLEEEPDSEYLAEDELAPIPQAAEHVLDKVNGEPLSRTTTLASILRRILPPRAITDATLLDNFTSIRNTVRNPLGLSATNIVSISSIPEQPNDPDSLGVGGMGKTTLAAMVAQHPDVRRYFIDGVVWVYVGDKELNYNRYTQCLRELVAQLDFYQGVPLFAELLHVPGEALSKRRRREEGFMIYARDTIAEILHDRSVLIILDDVCFEPDLDWFDFAPMPGEENDQLDSNCALLVTTRCRTLLPAADTVEVDMLDEADAISLLIQESGQLSHTLMAQSREARSVVRECANHPLAVKSVGRWLHLKHATAGVVSSVEEIHSEVIKSMDKILKGGDHTGTDMMYEILSMSLSPAINGEPTSIIKFCLAAFVIVFCDREYISDFALTEPTPIIPMDMAELLFETLLEMNESSLLQKGSLFYAQKKEAAVLIPEALSALGVLKVITYSDAEENEEPEDEQKFLQVMHFIHHEYGEYLCSEEEALKDLTKDAERQWNRALVEAYLSQVEEWDRDLEDAGHSYALEMIVSHMIRGGMSSAAADLLADKSFVRGRLLSLGRENATRRQIKDCEALFKKLKERRQKGSKLEPRTMMKQAYQALGSQLALDDEDSVVDSRIKDVEVARAHYEIGFSLAEKRCWDAAIAHWETSQGILVAALGTVEIVAGILFNIGVVYSEMNEYEQALDSLKQCLRIRGTIHGEEHILYAQTIQKIGDIFLGMSDYHEALESYNWALDVMYIDPNIHRVEIGEILDNKGTIHYSKGEIDEALQCHQEALRSKQFELGEDHPELASTYHHIGNCLSDQGNVDDAVVHFEEAIRLKELDPEGGPERDADVLTIEGILHNLEGNQDQGLECYEKSLQILVTKVPYRKEKVASLLHLIGCVYLMSGEQKKAMKLFEESLQARRKVLGFVHLDVASTLFNMAFLHQTRNRLDKALKCLEEALKIRQLRLPDSEKVAVTHEKIGSLARAIGKTKKAQINFEDALRIRRLIHGEQHEAVATVLQELGDLMDDLSEYDSAMSYYIDALDIRRNRLGLDDIAVAETLYSMGYTLHNNDEPDRALVCFEESLNIRRYQLGEDSKEVGDTLNMMGFLKAKRGELDDALTLLWDALRIRKIQEDHVKVSETLKNIGNVHREKKERDVAVECYEECLRIRRAELGPEHEKVADALIAMGNVQSDMDHKEDAMRSYQEALKIRTMLFGEHDEGVAAVLQYMGTMEFRSGNHDRARDLLTEFIRIRRDNGTKHDGDYVNVLFMIGNIHKMHNHEDDAQLCWSEAYQVFQELGLAETNPQIAKVMNHLLKAEEEKEEADKKKAKGASVFGKVTEKLKANTKEEKLPGKKRRKGKGIQL